MAFGDIVLNDPRLQSTVDWFNNTGNHGGAGGGYRKKRWDSLRENVSPGEAAYNGYFTIKDISETDPETGEVTIKIAVCDGATWDAELQTSENSACTCGTKSIYVPSVVFNLSEMLDAKNGHVEVYLVWRRVPYISAPIGSIFDDTCAVVLESDYIDGYHHHPSATSYYAYYELGSVYVDYITKSVKITQRHTDKDGGNGVPVLNEHAYSGAFSIWDATDYAAQNIQYKIRVRLGYVTVNGATGYRPVGEQSVELEIDTDAVRSIYMIFHVEKWQDNWVEIKDFDTKDIPDDDIAYLIGSVYTSTDGMNIAQIHIKNNYQPEGIESLSLTWYIELCALLPEAVDVPADGGAE